ncbi:hypothetical protein M514_07480 [Trichuris suis]|uniref:Uncharacterized protein n=1 Tax=Trichuris suis TaxID=68888 RepID=A0A085M305_9BILA|nr:hypothetical protein M513_07480 [Trichuris suis]KFD67740.1 hypothetical protein M514_07480 [Trichuris suis]
MARYFDVDRFFADVQNSKIELESLSDRLKRLKDSISSYSLEDAEKEEIKLPFRFRTNKLYKDVPAYGRRFVYDWERRFREDLHKQMKIADRVDSAKRTDNQLGSPPVVKARKGQRTEASPTQAAPDELDSLKEKLRALKAKGMELRQSVMNFSEKEAASNEASRGTRSPVLEKSIVERVHQPADIDSRKSPSTSVAQNDRTRTVKTSVRQPVKHRLGDKRPYVDENFRCLQRYVTRQRLSRRSCTSGARLPPVPIVVRERRTPAKERAPSAPTVKAVDKSEEVLRRIRPLYESRTSNDLKSRSAEAADANVLPGFNYDIESLDSVIEKIRKRYFGLMGPDAMYRTIRRRELPTRGVDNEASADGKATDASVQASVEDKDEDVTPPKSEPSEGGTALPGLLFLNLSFASSIAAKSNSSTSARSASPLGRADEDGATVNFKGSSPERSPKAKEPTVAASSDEEDSKTPTPTPSLVLNLQSSSNESVVTVQPSVSEPLSPEEEISKATSAPKESQQRLAKKTVRTESEVSELPLEANSGTTPSAKANSGQSQNSWKTEEVQLLKLNCVRFEFFLKEIFGRDMVKHSRRIYGKKSDEHSDDNLHRWASIHMKALRAYFEVQVALLHCEKKIGYRKNAEEYAKFIDEQVSELKQKFERESQSLQGSVVSVVDEIREVALLQEKTVALQKNLADMCHRGYSTWSLEKTALFDEQKKLLKQREAQAKRLIKERKALEKDAKIVAKLESKAFKAWSLPAGLWKMSSSLSSRRSEYSARIQALKKELEQRKHVARRLTYEYSQRSKQHLKSHEQSLAKQIEIYEGNIQKAEQMISDLTSAKCRGEVHTSPRMITSPRSSGPSARQSDVQVEQPKTQNTHIDVLNLENGVSTSSGLSQSESEENIDDLRSEHELVTENAMTEVADVEKAELPSLANSERHAVDLEDSSPKPLSVASPEGRSDMPGVISTFDAISPRLLHSSRLKATELLTTPFVPKLELHNLADEPEKDGVALLNAEATPRLGDDSYANLTQTPLVSSSKEAVRAIARVSVDCLLKQLATGQSLWKTPKAAELYFVACELSNHRRGNSDQFDHLFRDFIFDLCRDFVANIYGCEEKADCIGQAGCRYALSSQVIKGNDEMVKRLVDLLVLQSIFSSSRHARIDVVARRSWDDVDNRILSEMYEQDAVFFNLNAVEEEVRNASADVIVSHQMPVVVEECLRLIRP